MSVDGESINWYLSDLDVGKKDVLAAIVKTVMLVLNHLEFPEFMSYYSNRLYRDDWKIGLLVLRKHQGKSYADFAAELPSHSGVLDAGGVSRIPHKDTLRKFAARLPEGFLDRMIGETARLLCGLDVVAAVDSTGFSENSASKHFIKRLKQFGTVNQTVRDFAKATFVTDTKTLAVISCDVSDVHSADVKRFAQALTAARRTGVTIAKIVCDKGYDSEKAHEDARRILGDDVETVIPVRKLEPLSARSASKCNPGGRWRRENYRNFDKTAYALRPLVETVNSMIKRKMGDTLYGKSMSRMADEIKCMCIAHNVRQMMRFNLVII